MIEQFSSYPWYDVYGRPYDSTTAILERIEERLGIIEQRLSKVEELLAKGYGEHSS